MKLRASSRFSADRHQVVVYKATETKRYDFEAKSADEAAEIVFEIKKGISPYHNV